MVISNFGGPLLEVITVIPQSCLEDWARTKNRGQKSLLLLKGLAAASAPWILRRPAYGVLCACSQACIMRR